MMAMRSPSCTTCSGSTWSSRTTPGISVRTGISIFMDSRMTISSPSATICPSSATTCHTFAAISARISAIGGAAYPRCVSHLRLAQFRYAPSHGEDAVLAPGAVDALGARYLEAAPDRVTGLGGVDHVVELRVARGDVRVDVLADLLRQLEALLRPFLFGNGFDRLAVDDVDSAVGTHHRDLGRRPRHDEVGLVRGAVHHEVPGAVALAHHHADLGNGRLRDREQHLGAVADDPLLLDGRADDEPGDVVEEHERDPERVAQPDEARHLVGRVHVERAAQHHRLAPDDPDGLAADASETGHDVLGPFGLDPEHVAVVDDGGDHPAHVVRPPRCRGHDVVELLDPPVDGVGAVLHRRRLLVVRGEEGEVLANDLEALLVVRYLEIGDN